MAVAVVVAVGIRRSTSLGEGVRLRDHVGMSYWTRTNTLWVSVHFRRISYLHTYRYLGTSSDCYSVRSRLLYEHVLSLIPTLIAHTHQCFSLIVLLPVLV